MRKPVFMALLSGDQEITQAGRKPVKLQAVARGQQLIFVFAASFLVETEWPAIDGIAIIDSQVGDGNILLLRQRSIRPIQTRKGDTLAIDYDFEVNHVTPKNQTWGTR